MPLVILQPLGKEIEVPVGKNLLEVCYDAGMAIPASCGGKGLCGKCGVRILSGADEDHAGHDKFFGKKELAAGWRLSCLCKVKSDMVVDLSLHSLAKEAILEKFISRPVEADGMVKRVALKLDKPSFEDQRSDIERIAGALGMEDYPECSLRLLQHIPKLLRENDFVCDAVMYNGELLGIEPLSERGVLGVALDIGTTTVAGVLYDLHSGKALAVASRKNPQSAKGDDVISRIDHARKGKAEKFTLQSLIVKAVNEIISEVAAEVGANQSQVYFISICGNTTMHHLLLGIDPDGLPVTPFIPAVKHGLLTRASHVGIEAGHGARLYALPNISAYVGGDIVAGLLAHKFEERKDTALFIDVGTNGEMALSHGGEVYACSVAAGPAFEGARISCGMRAASGAVNEIFLEDGSLVIKTIDDAPVRGLCGTGLLDLVALLVEAGVISETGRLMNADELAAEDIRVGSVILERLKGEAGKVRFVLSDVDGREVVLTQADVREFQLAKAAVAAGVLTMTEMLGLSLNEIDRVLLAGAFGNFIKPENAFKVGLLPQGLEVGKVEFVGNAALAGAELCLLNSGMRRTAEELAAATVYYELSGRPDFQDLFADELCFE